MAYRPPHFMPYEPFLWGVGVVFNLLIRDPRKSRHAKKAKASHDGSKLPILGPLVKLSTNGGHCATLGGSVNLPEEASLDMGYCSDGIAISRDMGSLRWGVVTVFMLLPHHQTRWSYSQPRRS